MECELRSIRQAAQSQERTIEGLTESISTKDSEVCVCIYVCVHARASLRVCVLVVLCLCCETGREIDVMQLRQCLYGRMYTVSTHSHDPFCPPGPGSVPADRGAERHAV